MRFGELDNNLVDGVFMGFMRYLRSEVPASRRRRLQVRSWIRINRPALQTRHRRDDRSSVVKSRLLVGSALRFR